VTPEQAKENLPRAVVLFYLSGQWTPERAAEWERLTGVEDCTSRVLADLARLAGGGGG
jgi:hypothetical protein